MYISAPSGSNGGNCVEVAAKLPGIVALRDSKNPAGPALVVSRSAFQTFTTNVKAS